MTVHRGDADEHRLRRLRGQGEEGPSQASRRGLRGRGQGAGQGDGDRHGEPEEGAPRGAAHGEARRAVALRLQHGGVQPPPPPRLRAAGSGRPRAPILQQRAARHQRWRRQGRHQLVQLPCPRLLRLGPPRVLRRPRAARRAGRRADLLQRREPQRLLHHVTAGCSDVY